MFWFIGFPIEDKTDITYHLYTNKPNLLPEDRITYGFDSRRFRFRKDRINYKEFDSYIVFEKDIPEDYPIEKIVVGFTVNGTVAWRQSIFLSNAL
jgi:hypothetical protein